MALAFLIVLGGCLTSRCLKRPVPPTGDRASTDRLIIKSFSIKVLELLPFVTFTNALFHAYIAYSFPSPAPRFCPYPDHLNPNLFRWSARTATTLALIITSAVIRLSAIVQLGKSFTWELAKPTTGLKKDGLYGYVQHPSYTGMLLNVTSFVTLIMRIDGAVGCWLPAFMAHSKLLIALFTVGIPLSLVWSLSIRVKDEESMLQRAFGDEWEEYHRRTKRFIPGIC
ncbi:MAG: hypothetical protein M1837_000508 [Sclerophora amabilis]|nr:MAG: hypothetical protein M1837_000508 [Sclerophora amabilis]